MKLRDEDGLSLIELIITVLIIGVLGIAIGMIFINSVRAQDTVTTTTEATNSGQLYGQSIERAMRNAQAFDVTDSGRMLRVQTSLAGAKQCQAFWITKPSGSSDDALYMTSNASTLPGALTSSWPKPWHEVGGVATGDGGVYFADGGDRVSFSFNIKTDAAPVTITGSAARRFPSTGGANTCW
ncbi:MAG TPA: hypothetical protein VN041_11425 [Microbacterium sp.]|uniref:PilW family protein n=1 Tax=Microbacterium arabinogalactanolyticum TaxID=69365 RepID=UPI002BA93018|nr:hypothetical protein [Microbacterium sp.]